MSVIAQLKKIGLDNELDKLIGEKISNQGDAASRAELRKVIDDTGLKSPKTMQKVGLFQREGKLRPGLYKELVNLNQRLEDAEHGAPQQPTAPTVSQPAVAPSATTAEEKPMAEAVEVKDNLTEKEEQKVKDKMKKEEEKIRARLASRESKIRDRIKARAEKKAQRQGLKLESAQKIKENKDKIKAIRLEVKEKRDAVKKLRDEIATLRPARKKKEKTEKAEKPAKA